MSTPRQILAAIFDMDGLLIDSEPLWDRAELDVMASLGVDITRRHELPDTLGLRIDMVVDLWFAQQPWSGPDRQEVTNRVIARAITLIEETRPLLPGVREAVALEDSVNGLIAAKAARMRAIVVPEEENQHDPRFALANVKLNSLTELTAAHLLG
ncbi:hypothetical protein NRD63_002897 [Salmonella enterica]|nr:hypothetical protein [Salmonella enterica]